MKTMEMTTMGVTLYEGQSRVENLKKVVKKGLRSTVKFLMFISPVYPQCTQGMK